MRGVVAPGKIARITALAAVLAAAGGSAASAQAATCSSSQAHQVFLSQGDFNYYASAPGPNGSGYDGSTWSLTGGARVVSTQLTGGATGQVLDLPAGSQAVSPDICITSQDPLARMMVRSPAGPAGVSVNVSYLGPNGWSPPQGAGSARGGPAAWKLSGALNLHPNKSVVGWEVVRFTLAPDHGPNDALLYGLSIATPPPAPSTGACSKPVLSQIFLPAKDPNYYTQAPGQTAGGFVGKGWKLEGGARVVAATRANGSTGDVLDLPAGSMAVSPNICVTSLYPTARMMVRSVFGGDNLSFRVSYAATDSWTNPHQTGEVQGNNTSWSLSDPVQLQPTNVAGWQIVRLTLVPKGPHSEFQVYDLELDPYAKG